MFNHAGKKVGLLDDTAGPATARRHGSGSFYRFRYNVLGEGGALCLGAPFQHRCQVIGDA